MALYSPVSGDAERSDGRPSSANSSQRGSRYGLDVIGVQEAADDYSRPKSARGRKEVGMIGQASWISSVINLVNTSRDH